MLLTVTRQDSPIGLGGQVVVLRPGAPHAIPPLGILARLCQVGHVACMCRCYPLPCQCALTSWTKTVPQPYFFLRHQVT